MLSIHFQMIAIKRTRLLLSQSSERHCECSTPVLHPSPSSRQPLRLTTLATSAKRTVKTTTTLTSINTTGLSEVRKSFLSYELLTLLMTVDLFSNLKCTSQVAIFQRVFSLIEIPTQFALTASLMNASIPKDLLLMENIAQFSLTLKKFDQKNWITARSVRYKKAANGTRNDNKY